MLMVIIFWGTLDIKVDNSKTVFECFFIMLFQAFVGAITAMIIYKTWF